jgi:general secretion pathway protein M
MNPIKQLFAGRLLEGPHARTSADLGALLESGRRDIGKPAGAILVLGLVFLAGLSLYWISSNALATMQMNFNARQDLLSALQRSNETTRTALSGGVDPKRRNQFILAATETLAAAELDDELRRVTAEEDGIVLASHAEIDHSDRGPGKKIEIKALLEGKINKVQAVLFRLETSAPMIFVEALDLEPKSGSLEESVDADPVLHANVMLAAYWRDPIQKKAQRYRAANDDQ